jgi:hypothetical protein
MKKKEMKKKSEKREMVKPENKKMKAVKGMKTLRGVRK